MYLRRLYLRSLALCCLELTEWLGDFNLKFSIALYLGFLGLVEYFLGLDLGRRRLALLRDLDRSRGWGLHFVDLGADCDSGGDRVSLL